MRLDRHALTCTAVITPRHAMYFSVEDLRDSSASWTSVEDLCDSSCTAVITPRHAMYFSVEDLRDSIVTSRHAMYFSVEDLRDPDQRTSTYSTQTNATRTTRLDILDPDQRNSNDMP
jgi:hypothetical protein